MLRIVSHIENLLLNHDCVIVPGIGGFVTHFEEASFSEDGNEIYPPYCSVSFNAHLSDKEDKYGMLAQSYMTAYDINYPKALSLVREDVADMLEQLRKNMELKIGTIGTLQFTLNYTLLFTPSDECGIFAKELYGLVQAGIAQKCDSAKIRKSESVTETASGLRPQISTTKPQTSSLQASKPIIERDIDGTHYIIRVSRSAVRYALTTVAAALLYFVFTIAPSVSPVMESNVQQAGIAHKFKSAKIQKCESVTEPASNIKHQTSNLKPQPSYTLVLASAVSQKGAQRLVDELKADGFAGAKVIDDNGMTRVIFSAYPTEDDAYRAARTLRQQHEDFHSAWVMELEP